MTQYANTLNETFINVSEEMKEKGYRYFKRLLKVNNTKLKDFPLVEVDADILNNEVNDNMWFFMRELIVHSYFDGYFDWKTFIALELLNSKKSSIIIDDGFALPMYLRWVDFTDKNPVIVTCNDIDLHALSEAIDSLHIDDTYKNKLTRHSIGFIHSFNPAIIDGTRHIIIYAGQLTNELLAFYLLNKDKAQITIVIDEDTVVDDEEVLVPTLEKKFYEEFIHFDPSDLHRDLLTNRSIYADLMKQ